MPIAEDGSVVPASFYNVVAAARRYVDSTTGKARIAQQGASRQVMATISAVVTGGAGDGNALVVVQWRDAQITAAGYAASYTPVVGHRVVCHLIDNQLIVAHRVIGQP